MTSDTPSSNVLPEAGDGNNTETIPVSIRMRRVDAKLCRRAAGELDMTRSAFIAETAIERARQILRRQRATDTAA